MISFTLLLIGILYLLLIIYFIHGNQMYLPKRSTSTQLKVSVIIPFRNEEENLPALLESLKTQLYPKEQMQFIFVDDHSKDKGKEIIQEALKTISGKLIQLNNTHGKKEAIKAGINAADNEIIITTDADCTMNNNWLQSMMEYFETENPHLLLGPVELKSEKTIFSELQQLEFSALIASTQGAVAQRKPFMANGANLAFRKELYLEFNPTDLEFKQASGDDVFLLHAIKSKYGRTAKFCFANDSRAIVYTHPSPTISAFIHQRLRWSGKAKNYKDGFSILVSTIVLLGNIILPIYLILALLGKINWGDLASYFIFKCTVDALLIRSISQWRSFPINYLYILLLSLIYPLYFILLALLSLPFKPHWKERKV